MIRRGLFFFRPMLSYPLALWAADEQRGRQPPVSAVNGRSVTALGAEVKSSFPPTCSPRGREVRLIACRSRRSVVGLKYAGSGNRFPTDSGDGLERRMTAVCSRPTTGVAAIADPWISSRLLPPKTKGASTHPVSSGEAEEREFPRRWMPCLPRPSRNVIGQLGQEQFLVGIGLGTAG